MNQAEFISLYDRLARYATVVARRFFPDEGERQIAVDEAMDRFVDSAGFQQVSDELVWNPQITNLEAWAKTVISNALKNSHRDRKVDCGPASVMGEAGGFHVCRL